MAKNPNIIPHTHAVQAPSRWGLKGHKGKVIWFTGLSASGKSTIASALDMLCINRKIHSAILDGDNVRDGINADLGFEQEDRKENLRRIAHVAKLMADNGTLPICAFITPLEADREMISSIIGRQNIVWVYVDCPLEICEDRDPKGMYAKARKGEIKDFTGVSSAYEIPQDIDLTAFSHQSTAEELANEILAIFAATIKL
jgi:adenylylsulfate kinase